jgi:hypothetical protein
MTDKQWAKFFDILAGTFPEMIEWLENYNGKQVSKNLREAIDNEGMTLEELSQVLKGWATDPNREGAPVGYAKAAFSANLLQAVREARIRDRAKQSRKEWSRDILGECQDLPIRSKVPNKGPLVGRMVEEFERMRSMKLSKGLATV